MEIRLQCDNRRRVRGDTTLSKRPESLYIQTTTECNMAARKTYRVRVSCQSTYQNVGKVSRNQLLKTITVKGTYKTKS